MGSLQDALVRAGLADKDKAEKQQQKQQKKQQDRQQVKEIKPQVKMHSHHEHRTICEHCDRPYPDVEKYRHKNPVIRGFWLCLNCADDFMIPDELRETAQSEYNRKNIFRRRFGKTLKALPLVEEQKRKAQEREQNAKDPKKFKHGGHAGGGNRSSNQNTKGASGDRSADKRSSKKI